MTSLNAEVFWDKGRRIERILAQPFSQWVVGVDLGQRNDHTAVCAMHHTREPIDAWDLNENSGELRQKVEERFAVRGLQRLPLGMDYPDQAAKINELLSRPPLRGYADMVIDDAGVGAPVGDEFVKRWGVKPVRVTLSGTSTEVTRRKYRSYTVPKLLVVSHLDARFNSKELVFADDLPEREAIKDELTNFARHITAAGRSTFEARGSKHDDIVIATGLALWWSITKREQNRWHVGSMIGLY
jgi:hypothetical protein